MAILAISGRISSGKDTVGRIIQYLTDEAQANLPKSFEDWLESGFHVSNWEVKKFAFKLKQIVSMLTGCTVDDLESQDFKTKQLPEEWGNMTYREMLQKVGTEAMRNNIHENVWVNALFADYKSLYVAGIDPYDVENIKSENVYISNPTYPNWIITDLRFPNELKAVEDRGGITIRIERREWFLQNANETINTINPQNQHPSETALDNANFKYTIDNDGTIEELIQKVKEILIKENII